MANEIDETGLLEAMAGVGVIFEQGLSYSEGIRARMLGLGYSADDSAMIAAAQMRIFMNAIGSAMLRQPTS